MPCGYRSKQRKAYHASGGWKKPAYRAQGTKRGRVYKGSVYGSRSLADAAASEMRSSGMGDVKVKTIRKAPKW
jgi:L-alanine-DL-glutamate epimerase-like enolase superfamily enzyme